MPQILKLKQLLPYVIVLIGAGILYLTANRFAFEPAPGQMGPDVWPKIVLTLLIGVCLYEISRRALSEPTAAVTASEGPGADDADPVLEEHGADRPWLVAGTVAATVIYLLAIETGGFFMCTVAYAASLMWFGGIRRWTAIAAMSLSVATVFTFLFMKLIFVALPIGHGVFQKISLAIMALLGVR
jgi:putative tricarboxylic transport membrane protein